MKILFDIGHPAHVHLFKHVIRQLKSLNHQVYVIAKDQLAITALLDNYKIEYTVIAKKETNLIAKVFSYFNVILQTFVFVRKYKIDIGLGVSMSLPLVGKLTSMKTISLDDDDQKQTPIFAFFANMADVVLTPDTLAFEKRNKRHITHPSYHELAYLHPDRFTPDENVLRKLQIKEDERFFILRFNSFTAHHDLNKQGLTYKQKLQLVEILKKRGKVFISTEDIDVNFEKYRLPLEAEEIHSAMYYAMMFVGDSQTMTSEAAVLGTPALKCNSFAGKLSIPNELEEKYGLCYAYQADDFDKMIGQIKVLLDRDNLKEEWSNKRDRMLNERMDLSSFLLQSINIKGGLIFPQ